MYLVPARTAFRVDEFAPMIPQLKASLSLPTAAIKCAALRKGKKGSCGMLSGEITQAKQTKTRKTSSLADPRFWWRLM